MALENKPRAVRIPSHRRRKLATILLNLHPLHSSPVTHSMTPTPLIRIVTVSDTHNTQPDLPPGDVLIHAGDLSESGSFGEIQAQLTWLSSQPHRYKICVAGNHDVLLDEKFLAKYPERRYGLSQTMSDLDWGSVHYLQDKSLTLDFPTDGQHRDDAPTNSKLRTLTIYGSPWTPQYGVSAFQYPRDKDIWEDRIPPNTDILVTHGPPRLHLDSRDFHCAGCLYLAQQVARIRPRLVVFGHIHASYGREDVVLDSVRRAHEEILGDWAGWGALILMAITVFLARVHSVFSSRGKMMRDERVTTFVNAAVVGGPRNELQNQPIVVEI